jgi:hypothetical protein
MIKILFFAINLTPSNISGYKQQTDTIAAETTQTAEAYQMIERKYARIGSVMGHLEL